MRRNSLDKSNIRAILFFIFIIIYVTMSDVYYFLPPLFGVAYVYGQECFEQKKYNIFYFFIPFMLFFEANKGLPLMSSLLFFALSFVFIVPRVRKYFGYSKILIPLFIIYAYFGYFGFLYVMGKIFDYTFMNFSEIFVLYVVAEMFLVWIFLWVLP